MSDTNLTAAWTAGNPALWNRLESVNPESYVAVRGAWEEQNAERTLFALWDYMNPEADPDKGVSSIIEAYGSKAVLCELGVPEDQAEAAVGSDIMRNMDINVPELSINDALEQGIESVLSGPGNEVDTEVIEHEPENDIDETFMPEELFEPDAQTDSEYENSTTMESLDATDNETLVGADAANDVTQYGSEEMDDISDVISPESVEQFVKETLGENGAKEIEDILKAGLSSDDYQEFLDVCNHAKQAQDDGRPTDEVSQIIRDWADEQKGSWSDTDKQEPEQGSDNDPLREQYIKKMDEMREKKSEQIPYYRNIFLNYYDMKEKYYAMKADVPINGKPVTKTDLTISVIRFLNSRLIETLILQWIENRADRKENDDKPDVDNQHENWQDRDMGVKDDAGAYDNGYAKNVDRTEADAARNTDNPEYGQFFGANTTGDIDKRFSREDRVVWRANPLIEFAPRIDPYKQDVSRVQRIPGMRTVEMSGNFYLVNPFGKIEATKIYHQESVVKSFPDMDVTRQNDALVARMNDVAAERGLTLDQYKEEIEDRCKEAFADRIEAQWEGESQRLGSLIESIKGDIGAIRDQINNVDLQEQKIEAGNLSDTEKQELLTEVAGVRKELEAGLEKAQDRLDNIEKYKDYIDNAKDIASKSDLESRFSRAAIGESIAAGRAENVIYVSETLSAAIERLMPNDHEKQDVDKGEPNMTTALETEPVEQLERRETEPNDTDKNEKTPESQDTAKPEGSENGQQVDTAKENDDIKDTKDDNKPDDSKDPNPQEDDIDSENKNDDVAILSNKDNKDLEEENEKIDDVGAGAEEEEVLVESERTNQDDEPDTNGVERDIDTNSEPEGIAGFEVAESADQNSDTDKGDEKEGNIEQLLDTIRDFIDDRAEFTDILDSIGNVDVKDIIHDLAQKFLPDDVADKIDGIMDLFSDIHDQLNIPFNDLADAFMSGFDNITKEETDMLSEAIENAFANDIRELESTDGVVTIGEQPLGFGEDTGLIDLHTGDNVDGFSSDGAIENLIEDIARDTDLSMRELERPDMTEINAGADTDPMSVDEIHGQGMSKNDGLEDAGMDATELGAEAVESPVIQTGAEEFAAEAADVEELAALLL